MKRGGTLQIKIFLIGILIACSYLIGEFIYQAYTKRHKQLNELIRILEVMRMDLSFGLYTLEEVFFNIGNKKDFILSSFFKNMSNDLREEKDMTLDEILDNNTEKSVMLDFMEKNTRKIETELDNLIKKEIEKIYTCEQYKEIREMRDKILKNS